MTTKKAKGIGPILPGGFALLLTGLLAIGGSIMIGYLPGAWQNPVSLIFSLICLIAVILSAGRNAFDRAK
ncbi:MAG: hypothetical protein A2418_02270 [Candidatus Brennerbacteria bacterium RIFOXYC1_FULL_41_11]|uniref:Uncharacterized protein n=1 Tax=Candidatus Brennerbacteria bacterium RIFOXYD1_FULL_41_16 TaxID=1797529 RepID=A0A1G1XJN8_9BACT|nr:MAG: hypothetical protein A2418_02270 [Candidatus Brennerbacteria bacterium RIFOXYC1_FULL_41_11]OGY40162.1 MAG: hypothetical protein A2570_02650 [Candidatus Brennerbacteria bacterium RIFOXYD1_FULL_41_16]